jgi:hypothetical protein
MERHAMQNKPHKMRASTLTPSASSIRPLDRTPRPLRTAHTKHTHLRHIPQGIRHALPPCPIPGCMNATGHRRTTQARLRALVRTTRKIVLLFKLHLLFHQQRLHLWQMVFKHVVQRVLWGFDEVTELLAHFADAAWIPDEVAVFYEDHGALVLLVDVVLGGFGALTAWYQAAMVSSVVRFMDWIVVSATKPIRHAMTLSGSVQFSVRSVSDCVGGTRCAKKELTVVA